MVVSVTSILFSSQLIPTDAALFLETHLSLLTLCFRRGWPQTHRAGPYCAMAVMVFPIPLCRDWFRRGYVMLFWPMNLRGSLQEASGKTVLASNKKTQTGKVGRFLWKWPYLDVKAGMGQPHVTMRGKLTLK